LNGPFRARLTLFRSHDENLTGSEADFRLSPAFLLLFWAVSDRYDLAIIGGGIVGLATAYQLLLRRPGLHLAILEKEEEVATHQSGHNTGVIHAGIYYRPGSLKARLCREGKEALERFADEHGIPYRRCGKIILAVEESELERLAALRDRGIANGVEGLEEIGPERIREIEPHASGIRALHSPRTGAIDFRRVSLALRDEVRSRGGAILTGHRVQAILDRGGERILKTAAGEITTKNAIACAGLHSDRVAAMTGDAGPMRIVPFRGDYYAFKPEARHLVRALINPVPDPGFPFLGVHFSRRIDDEVLAGPNAVLAFSREGYRLFEISAHDLLETIAWPGFWKLIGRYLGTGLREMGRDVFKPLFVRQLQRYLPELTGDQLVPGPSGVRAQSLDRNGTLVDDFSFGESAHILHVRNAPSPAATSSLAIGRYLSERAEERFGL
jgi:L-2-hydroxyglutarate oxidase LhgO